MFATMMDNKPLPPTSAEPVRPDDGSWQSAPLSVQSDDNSAGREADVAETASPSFPLSPVARNESLLRAAFPSPRGIHAGSHLMVYLALAFVVFEVEGWVIVSLRPQLNDLWWRMLTEGSLMLAAILPGFAMARVENRPFGDFGLPVRRAFARNFWTGTLWGIASLSILILMLRATGAFEFGNIALRGPRIWKFAAYYAVLFLFTGLFEDFLMRGYSQWVLAQGINFWPAAVFLSIAFGAIHDTNPGESSTGLVAAGFIGLFLCLTLRRTGDLWWAIGFHMAWDWGESYLYSVPDSGAILPGHLLKSSLHGPVWLTGGSVGPEGSYLVFVVIGALWILFCRVYPAVKSGGISVSVSYQD